MDRTFLTGVLNNITLLLALGFLYSLCIRRWDNKTLKGRIMAGILFGSVAVIGMLFPLPYAPGIFLPLVGPDRLSSPLFPKERSCPISR